MDKNTARRIYDTVIYLISCALSGERAEADLIVDEAEKILSFAKRHSLNAIVTSTLMPIGLATPEAITERNLAIRKIMLLDAEREEILRALREHQIKYMVLKGVIIKEMYSSIGDRQMADNDILFDEQYRKTVRDIMLARGYEIESYDMGDNHDVYLKAPVYNFEMHTHLFNSYHHSTFFNYFESAFSRARQDGLAHYMTDEDYYVYIKAHEYKHYSAGGTGIRSLVDTFVYLNAKKSLLNWEYIEAEVKKLGISEYEKATAKLALKIFSPEFARANMASYKSGSYSDSLTAEERDMLDAFFIAGSYGTTEQSVEKQLDEMDKKGGGAKIKYIFSRIFPHMEYYKANYPRVYRYKILIPFFIIGRVFGMIFLRPRSTAKKLKTIFKHNKK